MHKELIWKGQVVRTAIWLSWEGGVQSFGQVFAAQSHLIDVEHRILSLDHDIEIVEQHRY